MNEKGFTLLEILIALAVGTVVAAVVFKFSTYSNEATALQMRKAEIQQNLRASMYIIESEIKRIGYNPANLQGANAPGITVANVGSITYQADINENGRSFSLVPFADGNVTPATDPAEEASLNLGAGDADADGVADFPPALLFKVTTNADNSLNSLPIAESIEVLNFVYLDADGAVVPEAAGVVDPAQFVNIRKIQVTIIARSSTQRRGYVNEHQYLNAQGQVILPVQDDAFDRALLTKTIHCRNLGLL